MSCLILHLEMHITHTMLLDNQIPFCLVWIRHFPIKLHICNCNDGDQRRRQTGSMHGSSMWSVPCSNSREKRTARIGKLDRRVTQCGWPQTASMSIDWLFPRGLASSPINTSPWPNDMLHYINEMKEWNRAFDLNQLGESTNSYNWGLLSEWDEVEAGAISCVRHFWCNNNGEENKMTKTHNSSSKITPKWAFHRSDGSQIIKAVTPIVYTAGLRPHRGCLCGCTSRNRWWHW